jgi:WD40 repeat protein
VVLAEPASLAQQAAFDAAERPADLAFVGDGSTLTVAAANDTGGTLHIWKLTRKKERPIEIRKSWQLSLAAAPLRLAASPDGRFVAVALADGRVQVVDVADRLPGRSVELGAPLRDLVWCDPTIPGPSLPVWSDAAPPSLDLGG